MMKKLVIISFIFLFLSFNMNTIPVVAIPKTFSQGIYKVRDSGLIIGSTYNVENASPSGKSIVMIIDSNQIIQELIRLEPRSPKYQIKPLQYDYVLVVVGDADVILS